MKHLELAAAIAFALMALIIVLDFIRSGRPRG